MKCNYKPSPIPTNYNLTSSQLETLTAQNPDRYKQGEVAYLTDLEKVVMWNGETWVDLPSSAKIEGSKSLGMNLYDLNKSAMASFPIMEDFTTAINLINEFNSNNTLKYAMLLCKDISYYTVFIRDDYENEALDLGNSVIECALNVGSVLSVDLTEDQQAIEIWVRDNNNENLCMYLFNCAGLIVKYNG